MKSDPPDDRADDVPLPLRDVARVLGIDGARDAPTKWLHRRLVGFQCNTGETVLIGNGKLGPASRYRVTIRDARRACAAFLPPETPAAAEARLRTERMLAAIRGDLQGWLGDALDNLRSLSGQEAD